MPHFIIECSKNITKIKSKKEIMEAVYLAAESTKLFQKDDVKVRIATYKDYKLGATKSDFLHVFAFIMEGRTTKQKTVLSRKIIEKLNKLLPDVSILSINIQEFELASYCNKALVNPLNKSKDRYFKK